MLEEIYAERPDENWTDGRDTAERVNRFLAQHKLFAKVRYLAGQTQDRRIIPEEPIKKEKRKKWMDKEVEEYLRNLAEQPEKQDEVRGKNRFGAVTQVLQGIQSLSATLAGFSRRYLQRGSDSRKANGYDDSSLPYKMKRLNPPE